MVGTAGLEMAARRKHVAPICALCGSGKYATAPDGPLRHSSRRCGRNSSHVFTKRRSLCGRTRMALREKSLGPFDKHASLPWQGLPSLDGRRRHLPEECLEHRQLACVVGQRLHVRARRAARAHPSSPRPPAATPPSANVAKAWLAAVRSKTCGDVAACQTCGGTSD
jgi:ribosomal protein L37E